MNRDINSTRLVVGLGNPGRKYARTRHNAGFMAADALAGRWQAGKARKAFSGLLRDARIRRGGSQSRVLLLSPQTYMNRSGMSVRETVDFFRIDSLDVLVIVDDLALPPGMIRARPEGSDGGHNGLSDVLRTMGSDAVPRLRIGIGPSPDGVDPADYVLAPMGDAEFESLRQAVELAADAVEDWVFEGMTYVMGKYNRREAADGGGRET